MLRRWLLRPLAEREAIFERHDAVDELTRSRAILEQMIARLQKIADLERIASRVTLRSASPRECLTLADSLLAVEELGAEMRPLQGPLLATLRGRCGLGPSPSIADRGIESVTSLRDVVSLIAKTIAPNPAVAVREGGVIADGVDPQLDELRSIARDSKTILLENPFSR